MLCQNCEENEANVKYTQIINGEKKEIVLCEGCSHKLGIDKISLNMPIDFSSFFSGILEDYDNDFMQIGLAPKELKCNYCNMTYNEFMENGKFGCSNCYEVFAQRIDPILKRLNGNSEYLGRNSKIHKMSKLEGKKEKKDSNYDKLQQDLKDAIKEERYEDAAKIRDDIKKTEKRGDENA